MKNELLESLQNWDGVHIDYVTNLYQTHCNAPSFFDDLIEIYTSKKDLQKVTTWLIKHHYDNGKTLPQTLTEQLAIVAPTVENWEAKLHILQLLPHFKLTDESFVKADDFVRQCLKDKNKFVKAWAYHGMYELSIYVPEMKEELEHLCNRAMETESASVKSKVKKVLLKLSKRK